MLLRLKLISVKIYYKFIHSNKIEGRYLNLKSLKKFFALSLALALWSSIAIGAEAPLVIQEQGSFLIGGSTLKDEGEFVFSDLWSQSGQTAYGDHAYVFYQKPVSPKKFPLVFLHGGGQSKKTWETTPDGREGFQNIFLRRGFSTYLVDQPRRGEAGFTLVSTDEPMTPAHYDRTMFTLFRLGRWPEFYSDTQFPKDKESLNQFMRQGTPNTGPLDFDLVAESIAALLNKIGPSILVTHSQGGGCGWITALKTDNIKAIVAYEPGGSPRLFPEGEVPETVQTSFGPIAGTAIPLEEFKKFTKFPIVIFYGDHIAKEPTDNYGADQWRGELQLGRKFAELVNKYGGDATVIHLPELGIKGNTHFLFSDKNNIEVADLLSKWLKEKGLDE
ncbi:MAG: alpha/beta fold hydrolase [Synergistaceae bacterium]|nr:alpha/beta fold hydrolase [Synergistaceae bacterium]